MAFGKDPNALNNVTPFGGRASTLRDQARITNARPQNRSSAPYYLNQYKPVAEDGAPADLIRLIKGEYKVQTPMQNPMTKQWELVENTLFYYPAIEHTFMVGPNQPRGYLCSGGPWAEHRDKREPCLGCENYFANRKDKKNSPHGRASLSVFSVLHFGLYAKQPQVDGQGQLRMNPNTNQAYYEWVRIFPQEVRHHEQQGHEIRDWALMHWPMKWGAFQAISAQDAEVANHCRTCGSQYSIYTVAWLCGGCGTDLIDPSTTMLSKDELSRLTSNPVNCSQCGHFGMMNEMIACNACQQPERASIFDGDLRVRRARDPKTDRLELRILGFEGPRPLDARFTTPGEEGKKPIAHAIDLARIYAPTPIERQEEILGGSKTGRAPVTSQQFSKPWGNNAPVLGGGNPQGSGGGGQGPNYG